MSDLYDPQSGPEFSSLEDLMAPPGGSGYGPLKLREDVTTRMMYPSSSDGLHEGKLLPRFLGPGYKQKYDWGKVHDTVDSLYQTLPQAPYSQEYAEKQPKPLASFRDWLDRAPEHVTAGYKGYASLGLGDEQTGETNQAAGSASLPTGGTDGATNGNDRGSRYSTMMRDAQNWLEKNDGLVKRAIQLGNEASREAKEKFPGESLHNGIGDASRHALWNEKLTREFGAPVASVITTLYETKNFIEALDYTDGRGPRLDETAMDMANNWIGRQRIDVDWLSRNGLLVTLKNDPKPEEDSRPEAEPKPEAELKSEPEGQGEAYE